MTEHHKYSGYLELCEHRKLYIHGFYRAYLPLPSGRILMMGRQLSTYIRYVFRWLDVTPMGRIITRCTQDMSSIDETFNRMVNYLLTLTISLICLFSSSVIMAGWYALVPGFVIAVLGAALGRVYLKCQIGVRREMR